MKFPASRSNGGPLRISRSNRKSSMPSVVTTTAMLRMWSVCTVGTNQPRLANN